MNTLYSFPLDFDKNVNQSNYYWFEEGFTTEELKTLGAKAKKQLVIEETDELQAPRMQTQSSPVDGE